MASKEVYVLVESNPDQVFTHGVFEERKFAVEALNSVAKRNGISSPFGEDDDFEEMANGSDTCIWIEKHDLILIEKRKDGR
tara:strand:- start:10761 stop:11003 length:243 start_codon:yes stop_codon:yes gene_type:complete